MATQPSAGAASARDGDAVRNLTRWIEQNVGGRVLQLERQSRWRPVWRAEVSNGGATRVLQVKGERTWNILPYSLAYEARMMQVLEANGIRQVPHVYGVCDDPVAFVMDMLEGDRNTDLIRTTIAETSTLSPERRAASLEYMDILASMHRIDPAVFAQQGAQLPIGATEIALANAERYKLMLDAAGIVEPSVTFAYSWIRRNVPEHRTRCAFLTGDCGQFLNKGSAVSAILDMEMGHLGDPLHDLACFRGRHPAEDMGDVPALYARYAQAAGEPIDLPVLAYHTVVFHSLSLCAATLLMAERAAGGSWVEAAMQVNFIGRRGMEALAQIIGVELEDISLPSQARATPIEDLALASLIREIDQLPTSADFAAWQRAIIGDVPRFLLNQAHFGQWAAEQDIAEITAILGVPQQDLAQANRALNVFVERAGREHDASLVRYFQRSFQRQCRVFAGPDASARHLLFAKMEPLPAH